jgi:hypothetical protein
MLRVFLINALLLFLPTLVYFAYVWVARKDGRQGEVSPAPVFWLFAIGLMMMVAGIGYSIQVQQGKPGQKYHPATVKDGVFVPGHME